MKKLILAIALALLVGITGFKVAEAGWGGRANCGSGPCNSSGCNNNSAVDQEAYDKFHEETIELRTRLMEKRSEYFAALNEDHPDKEYAAQLWSEMFDLQEQLRDKAEAVGIEKGFGMGGRRFPGRSGGVGLCDGPESANCWNNQNQGLTEEN